MPKTLLLPLGEDARRYSGIGITWTPSAGRLNISGWYDSCVGIQDTALTLAEFFTRLGITEGDVRRAFREVRT